MLAAVGDEGGEGVLVEISGAWEPMQVGGAGVGVDADADRCPSPGQSHKRRACATLP